MNSQQMLDVVIVPTLQLMQQHGNYDTLDARMLLLATIAVESDMGLYNRQIKGPAVSPFQLEPTTIYSTAMNWDAWPKMIGIVKNLSMLHMIDTKDRLVTECEVNSRLACLIARGKYAMDPERIPGFDDKYGLFCYYKRIYNTEAGATTWHKFNEAWKKHGLDEVVL